jgi:hypothetical protein
MVAPTRGTCPFSPHHEFRHRRRARRAGDGASCTQRPPAAAPNGPDGFCQIPSAWVLLSKSLIYKASRRLPTASTAYFQ